MSTAPPPYAEKSPYQQGAVPIVQPIYAATMPIMVGTYPIQCTCPQCRMQIVTRVEKKNGLLVWLACGGLFIIGCWPCYFIPFCVDAVKDTEHYCPSCGAVIARSFLVRFIDDQRKRVRKEDIRLEPYISKGVYTQSDVIRPMPKRYPLGIIKILLVVIPYLYLSSLASKYAAIALEKMDVFVYSDDDDDDDDGKL